MTSENAVYVDSAVTTIILQRPHKQRIREYESWLKEIISVSKQFKGHRGVNVIAPHGNQEDYTIVLHFDSEVELQSWLNSSERKELIKKVTPLLLVEEKIEIKTGLEFWFTPSENKAAPAYKQFIITLSVVFPLTVLVPALVFILFEKIPALDVSLIKKFAAAVIIVGTMIYIVMPRYTKLLRKWLYR